MRTGSPPYCSAPRVRREMVGAPDVVQPWMPRAARDSDAWLCHVSIAGGARRRGCAAAGVSVFLDGPLSEARGLLLRAREGPADLSPALLAEDEAQLAGGPQPLRVVGAERRAGLVELQRAKAAGREEALLARHLLGPLRARRRGSNG